MATNLEVHRGRTYAAPSLNFMFVPSSRNKHAVAKCCAQLGEVGKCRVVGCEEGGGGGEDPAGNASFFLRSFVIA